MKNLKKFIAVIAICLLAVQAASAIADTSAATEVTLLAKSDIIRKPGDI